jgi:hypothetical protein
VVGQVVTGEGVDEIDVAGDKRGSDGDDLALACGLRRCGSAFEQVGRIRREECRGDQGDHVIAGVRLFDDRGDGGWVTDGEFVDQLVWFCGHSRSIDASPDTGLTRGIGRTLRW